MRRLLIALPAVAALVPAAPASGAPRVLSPSDRLTVRDARQVTGRRVHLPVTNCARQRSTCDEIRLVNQLDGFDLDPRIAIRFDRPVNLGRAARGITLRIARGGTRMGRPRATSPVAPLKRLAWVGRRQSRPALAWNAPNQSMCTVSVA